MNLQMVGGLILFFQAHVGLTLSQPVERRTDLSFHPPVAHDMRLSGTFGELRGNHFHAGIDIKSKSMSWGDPVYAIESGHVSRVTVSAGGFGNAIYIQHANGLTSVYAHLQSFAQDLTSYIEARQQAHKTFEIDLDLAPNQFRVNRGQIIGKVGSTGHSYGLHLHFEIRNTKTSSLINPLRYSFDIPDKHPPTIQGISIYSLDHKLYNYEQKSIDATSILQDTVEINAWRIGLGIEAVDIHNGGRNRNGIYSAKLWVDGHLIYGFSFDSLRWKQKPSYRAHIDYKVYVENTINIHKCYRLPTNDLTIYNPKVKDGVIPLFRDRIQQVMIAATDFAGNRDSIQFYVRQADEITAPVYPTYHYHLKPGREDTIKEANLQMIFPDSALFGDFYCFFKTETDSNLSNFSQIFRIHDATTPLKNKVEIRIRPRNISKELESKLVIAQVDDSKGVHCYQSRWEGDWLKAEVSKLGDFFVLVDTIGPTIKPLKNTITNRERRLVFELNDDFTGSSIEMKYEAQLDNEWILAKYDLKNKQISCTIDEGALKDGTHHFKLLVRDAVANTTHYDYRFTTK